MIRDQCANGTDPAKKYIFENDIHQIFFGITPVMTQTCHNRNMTTCHDTEVFDVSSYRYDADNKDT